MQNFDISAVGACTLNRAFGYKPEMTHALLDEFGSIESILSAALFSPVKEALSRAELDKSRDELERLSKLGIRFMPIGDPAYPELLAQCPDSPAGLYIRSVSDYKDIFDDSPFVSIVGTRDISPYGHEWTRRIVFALARAKRKPVIVSGLALGVDIAAHRAALEAGLRTIAVTPTGLDDVYPVSHLRFAETISRTPGCALVTDFPPKTGAMAATFLRRNRIIAGLSGATILIESKIKGGGLITANHASGYGRDVFVLPGRLDDARSLGCLELLRNKVAEPITNLDMLSDDLGLGSFNRHKNADLFEEVRQRFGNLDEATRNKLVGIMRMIRSNRGIDMDSLSGATGIPFAELISLVSMLENEGFIAMDVLRRCTVVVRNH